MGHVLTPAGDPGVQAHRYVVDVLVCASSLSSCYALGGKLSVLHTMKSDFPVWLRRLAGQGWVCFVCLYTNN